LAAWSCLSEERESRVGSLEHIVRRVSGSTFVHAAMPLRLGIGVIRGGT
jgi:hypothetical protein